MTRWKSEVTQHSASLGITWQPTASQQFILAPIQRDGNLGRRCFENCVFPVSSAVLGGVSSTTEAERQRAMLTTMLQGPPGGSSAV